MYSALQLSWPQLARGVKGPIKPAKGASLSPDPEAAGPPSDLDRLQETLQLHKTPRWAESQTGQGKKSQEVFHKSLHRYYNSEETKRWQVLQKMSTVLMLSIICLSVYVSVYLHYRSGHSHFFQLFVAF